MNILKILNTPHAPVDSPQGSGGKAGWLWRNRGEGHLNNDKPLEEGEKTKKGVKRK